MELLAATQEPCVRCLGRVRALGLLQVVDVLDLRVRADALVVPTEVGLSVREKHRLVRSAPERRHGEVPPLREEERREEDHDRKARISQRSEEHTSELQSRVDLVCRLLLEKK